MTVYRNLLKCSRTADVCQSVFAQNICFKCQSTQGCPCPHLRTKRMCGNCNNSVVGLRKCPSLVRVSVSHSPRAGFGKATLNTDTGLDCTHTDGAHHGYKLGSLMESNCTHFTCTDARVMHLILQGRRFGKGRKDRASKA